MSFFAELKRRNVFRVGIAYVVASWLLIQVSDILFESIGAPPWVMQAMFILLAVGLVIALIFAWAFELTPEGVKKEKDVDRSQSITQVTGQKLNSAIIGVLVLALAYFVIDKFILTPNQSTAEPGHFSQQAVDPGNDTEEASALAPAQAKPTEPNDAEARKSIVVLPFVNMSNDPDQEFFSDGLSEELLNVLAQIKDLRVISRTSAFAFKGKGLDIPTIAAQLDVTHVLEGSVRKAGEDVRITAQLIEVSTDSHLWSDAYNRKLVNVFEIQEEISKAIAGELQVTLGTTGGTGQPTENLEAWQLFLRGRHLYQNRGQAQLARSLDLLKQAVELDPNFAEAWATLAAAKLVYGFGQEEGYEILFRDGQRAALQAIQIDPDNGFAHAVLGLVHMSAFSWDEAMREFDLAIQLNPNETNSLLWKGIASINLGYVDQAIAMFQRAEDLDPVFTNVHNWLASGYRVKGDVEGMRRHVGILRRIDPEFDVFIFSSAELYAGNLDAAEETTRAEDLKTLGTDVLAVAMFSALKDPGRKDEAINALLANKDKAETGDVTQYLWTIGAVDETIANFQEMRARGRGLRAANALQILWDAYSREQLSNPAMPVFFEASGMADFWRENGDPDYCRVVGASIECAGS